MTASNTTLDTKATPKTILQVIQDMTPEDKISEIIKRIEEAYVATNGIFSKPLAEKDAKGHTPLHLAVVRAAEIKDITAVIGCLLLKGASVNTKNAADHTPLISAVKLIDEEAIRVKIVEQILQAVSKNKSVSAGVYAFLMHIPLNNGYSHLEETVFALSAYRGCCKSLELLLSYCPSSYYRPINSDINIGYLYPNEASEAVNKFDCWVRQEVQKGSFHVTPAFLKRIKQPAKPGEILLISREKYFSPALLIARWRGHLNVVKLLEAHSLKAVVSHANNVSEYLHAFQSLKENNEAKQDRKVEPVVGSSGSMKKAPFKTIMELLINCFERKVEPTAAECELIYQSSGNTLSEDGSGVLHRAVEFGYTSVVAWLISKKVDIDVNHGGFTLLQRAAQAPDIKIAADIVNVILKEVDSWVLTSKYINATSRYGCSALFYASKQRNKLVIDALRKRNAMVNDASNRDEIFKGIESSMMYDQYALATPFFQSWLENEYSLLEERFSYSHLNCVVRNNNLPFSPALLIACTWGYLEIAAALLANNGADPIIVHDLCQRKAFDAKFSKGFLQLPEIKALDAKKTKPVLMRDEQKSTFKAPADQAVANPSTVLQVMRNRYVNQLQKNDTSELDRVFFVPTQNRVIAEEEGTTTAMHFAAAGNDAIATDWLRDHKYSVDLKNQLGNTPLHIAVGMRHISVLEKLIEAGAKVETSNLWNRTPLMDAVDAKVNESIVNKLVAAIYKQLWNPEKYIAHLDVKEIQHTPLCSAVNHRRLDLVKTLLGDKAFNFSHSPASVLSFYNWIVSQVDQFKTSDYFKEWIKSDSECIYPIYAISANARKNGISVLGAALIIACFIDAAEIADFLLSAKHADLTEALHFNKRSAFLPKYADLFAYHQKIRSIPDEKKMTKAEKDSLAILIKNAEQHGFSIDNKWRVVCAVPGKETSTTSVADVKRHEGSSLRLPVPASGPGGPTDFMSDRGGVPVASSPAEGLIAAHDHEKNRNQLGSQSVTMASSSAAILSVMQQQQAQGKEGVADNVVSVVPEISMLQMEQRILTLDFRRLIALQQVITNQLRVLSDADAAQVAQPQFAGANNSFLAPPANVAVVVQTVALAPAASTYTR